MLPVSFLSIRLKDSSGRWPRSTGSLNPFEETLPAATSYRARLRSIKMLLLDVDGVMTDGGIYFSERGDEMKKFNIQDGYGIVSLQRHGVIVGIITGRASDLVRRRAQELGISEVHENLENKQDAYEA